MGADSPPPHVRGPSPPPYRNPHAKVALRHVPADGNSTAWVFALTARATPPNLSFTDEKTLSTLFRFRNNLRKAPGRSSRNLSISAPASSPSILWSDLGQIAGRRPLFFMAWQFSTPPYWESAGTSPDPRGALACIVLKYGESFAPPGVTAAAHAMPCRARATRGFANRFTPIVPYPASCQFRHLDVPNPAESTILAPRAVASPAIHPIVLRGTTESVCDIRRRHRDLPYGRSSPRRFMSPGGLAERLTSPQRDGPLDFKAAAGTA